MSESKRRIDVTMKVTDKLVKLSMILGGYGDNGAEKTARMYKEWMSETEGYILSQFGNEKAEEFKNINSTRLQLNSADGITQSSRLNIDYLQSLVEEYKG